MSLAGRLGREPLRATASAGLPELVQALGSRGFGPALAAYADAAFGGHVVFAYRWLDGRLVPLAAGHVPPDPTDVLLGNLWQYTAREAWRHDMALHQALAAVDEQPRALFHDQGGAVSRRHWPWVIPTPLVDKLLLSERTPEGRFVVEFSRWGWCAGFSPADQAVVAELGPQLVALTLAHHRLLALQRDPLTAFRSAEVVEQCLAATTDLSPRERQVCALQLLGAKPAEVSAQLAIGAESVKSYRKRAYLRLGIRQERELVLKVLALSVGWRGLDRLVAVPAEPQAMGFLQAWRA